jgi:hypothetical protein
MRPSLAVNDISSNEIGARNFPKDEMLTEATYKVIKVLRPDLLNDSIKVLREEYVRHLKNMLAQYIN